MVKKTTKKIPVKLPSHPNQSPLDLASQIRSLIQSAISHQIPPFTELPSPFHLSYHEFDTFLNAQERLLLRPLREKLWKLYALKNVLFNIECTIDDRSMGMPIADYEKIKAEEDSAILSRVHEILNSTTIEIDSDW